MNVGIDRKMDRKFSPFYRTLSPIGAAALLTLKKISFEDKGRAG